MLASWHRFFFLKGKDIVVLVYRTKSTSNKLHGYCRLDKNQKAQHFFWSIKFDSVPVNRYKCYFYLFTVVLCYCFLIRNTFFKTCYIKGLFIKASQKENICKPRLADNALSCLQKYS